MTPWSEKDGQLYRKIVFSKYTDALDFVVKVAKLSDAADHHPRIVFDYHTVEILLFTHDQNTITDKDYKLAEAIERLI